jgi:hypothetical protein
MRRGGRERGVGRMKGSGGAAASCCAAAPPLKRTHRIRRWPTGSASPPAESSPEWAAPAGEGGPTTLLRSGRTEESRGGRESVRRGKMSWSVGGPRFGWFVAKREASQGCATELGRLQFVARHA